MNEHALLTHAGCALATIVEHALSHVLQLIGSLVRSTQLLLQLDGAFDGQLETHM